MLKNKITPIFTTLISPLLIILISQILNLIILNLSSSKDTAAGLSTVSATVIVLFLVYLLGKKVLHDISAKNIYRYLFFSLSVHIGIFVIVIILALVIQFHSRLFAIYLLVYLVSFLFVNIAYFFAPIKTSFSFQKSAGIFLFFSCVIFFGFLDFYIENSSNFTDPRVVGLHLLYLIITALTTFFLDEYLNKEKETALQKVITFLWIVILLTVIEHIAFKLNFSSATEYLTLSYTLFTPIALGLFINALLITLKNQTEQKPITIGSYPEQNFEQFHIPAFLGKLINLLIFNPFSCMLILLIEVPVFVIHTWISEAVIQKNTSK